MRMFEKLTIYNEYPTSKQVAEIDSLISEDSALGVIF